MKYYKLGSKRLLSSTKEPMTRKRQKKSDSAPVPAPLKKYVKNAILRQEETRVHYSEVNSGTTARVPGSFIKHRVGAGIGQSNTLGGRAGAEVFLTSIKLQLNIRIDNQAAAGGFYTGTGKVRLLLLEDKEPDTSDSTDTIASRLFESEGDVNSPVAHTTTGNYLQVIKKINRMRWTVHHDEVVTVKADSSTDATSAIIPRLSDRTCCKTVVLPVNRKMRFRQNYNTSPRGIDPCYYILWFYEVDDNGTNAKFEETITFREYFKDA